MAFVSKKSVFYIWFIGEEKNSKKLVRTKKSGKAYVRAGNDDEGSTINGEGFTGKLTKLWPILVDHYIFPFLIAKIVTPSSNKSSSELYVSPL